MNCRVCANTPFGALFGAGREGPEDDAVPPSSPSDSSVSDAGEIVSPRRRGRRGKGYDPLKFSPRNSREREIKIQLWMGFVHPRVQDLWGEADYAACARAAFIEILNSIDKRDDPVLGDDAYCIIWHGRVNPGDGYAIMNVPRVAGPQAKGNMETYVTRTLSFLFADSASFAALAQAGIKGHLDMICDNARCVNLRHVIVPEETSKATG